MSRECRQYVHACAVPAPSAALSPVGVDDEVVRSRLVRLRVHRATVLVLVFTRRRQMMPRLVHPLVLARRRRQQSDVAHARVVRFRVGGRLSSAGVRRALCLRAGNIPGCLYNLFATTLKNTIVQQSVDSVCSNGETNL